jgi:NitT/TauT family transport system substrate-binding protein/putative hydroxymethylpyrimidine transport system substrate-binding protein
MKRVAALLATAIAAAGLVACGSGAEPGAPKRATLVLDFQPNAVHAGIYAALREGFYSDAGVDLNVQQPSASTDAPKLLEAGRAQFAILDIHDLAIARERGFDLVGVMPIVQRPLAAVIAGDRSVVRRPRDLEGRTVGVTGLPSDDAVLDSVVAADGGDPSKVHRVTIGFNAVAALAAHRVDAATAFWNAEGVTLARQGIPTRTFRVDDYGAPRYPELVLVTTEKTFANDPQLVSSVLQATTRGYTLAVERPARALNDLLAADSSLDRSDQRAELHALEAAKAFSPPGTFDFGALRKWSRWVVGLGIFKKRPDIVGIFAPGAEAGQPKQVRSRGGG